VREKCRQYIESLYDKDGKPKKEHLQVGEGEEVDEDEKGSAVLKSEMLSAISEIKEGKVLGANEIQLEIFKSLAKAIQELCEIQILSKCVGPTMRENGQRISQEQS
jgi:hypothetical protein